MSQPQPKQETEIVGRVGNEFHPPPTLTSITEELRAPFPIEIVELKPTALSKDRPSGLATPYVDKRHYEERLDALVGIDGWQSSFQPWGDNKVICHLTVLGVTKSEVGEADAKDTNAATIASAQAFKRACASFGPGRYFYFLPHVWGEMDEKKKYFLNPQKVVREMYHKGGIIVDTSQQSKFNPQPTPASGSQTQASSPKSDSMIEKRAKGIAAMGLVTRDGDHYQVQSPTIKGSRKISHQVSRDERGKVICDCPEYEAGVRTNKAFRCEHIIAVKLWVNAQEESEKQAQAAEGSEPHAASGVAPLTAEELFMEPLTPADETSHKRAKGIAAVNNVTRDGDGFVIKMLGFKNQQEEHRVFRDPGSGQPRCTCDEFSKQRDENEDDTFRCVHMLAVQYFLISPAASKVEEPAPPLGFPRDPKAKSVADLVTPKQLGMIRALAREAGIDVEEECQSVLRCKTEEMSKKAASSFIDHLKGLVAEAKAN